MAKRPSSRSLVDVFLDARKRKTPSENEVRFRLSDGTEERADRALLAERCEKFSSALSGPWADAKDGLFDAAHHDPGVVRAFMLYLHTDSLVGIDDARDKDLGWLLALMAMADEFLFERLADECKRRLLDAVRRSDDDKRFAHLRAEDPVLSDLVWDAYDSDVDCNDKGPTSAAMIVKSGGVGGDDQVAPTTVVPAETHSRVLSVTRVRRMAAVAIDLGFDSVVRFMRIARTRRAIPPAELLAMAEQWVERRAPEDAARLRDRIVDLIPLAAVPTHVLCRSTLPTDAQKLEAIRVRTGTGFVEKIVRSPQYASHSAISPERLSFFSAELQTRWSIGEASDASASPFLLSSDRVRFLKVGPDGASLLGDGACLQFECEVALFNRRNVSRLSIGFASASAGVGLRRYLPEALSVTLFNSTISGDSADDSDISYRPFGGQPVKTTKDNDGGKASSVSSLLSPICVTVSIDPVSHKLFMRARDRSGTAYSFTLIPERLWSTDLLPAVSVYPGAELELTLRGTKPAANPFLLL